MTTSRILLVDLLNGRYINHPSGCHCEACETGRIFQLMDDLNRLRDMRTADEIIAELAVFTDEQRSLAWSPEPPFESSGAGDCRLGGSAGLDFNDQSRHGQWVRARHRMRRELRRGSTTMPSSSTTHCWRSERCARNQHSLCTATLCECSCHQPKAIPSEVNP